MLSKKSEVFLTGLLFLIGPVLIAGPVYVAKLTDLNSYNLFANGGWDGNWYIGYNNCWIEELPAPPQPVGGKYVRAYIGVKIGRAKTRNISGRPVWEKEPIPGSIYVAISDTPSWRGQDSFFLADTSEIPLEGDQENALEGVGESRWFWTEIPLEKINFSGPNFIAVWSPTPYFVSRDSAPILAGGWGDKEVNTWLDNTIAGYPPLSAELKTPVTIFEPAIALKLIPENAPQINNAELIKIKEIKNSPGPRGRVIIADIDITRMEKSYPEISADGIIWQKAGPVVYSPPYTYVLKNDLLTQEVRYLRLVVIDEWGNKIASRPVGIEIKKEQKDE